MSTAILYFSTSKDGHMGITAKANRRKYFAKIGLKHGQIADIVVTHGNKIKVVSKKDGSKNFPGYDGIITKDKDLFLGLTCADCMPIAVINPVGGSIGLIHCGFRGLDNGVIGKVVEKMENEKSENGKLLVYIGPHICKDHYVRDLAGEAKDQLVKAGVKAENITIDPRCTFEDKSLFSYRRGNLRERNLYLFSLSSAD